MDILPTQSEKTPSKIIVISLILVGFIFTFFTGFFLNSLLQNQISTGPGSKNPQPTSTKSPENPQETTKFLPGKFYFDDTIMLVNKNEPHQTLVATVTRLEQDSGYAQNTRVSSFDGKGWTRKIAIANTPDSSIVSGDLVKNWTTTLDPTRVLKEKSTGEVSVDNSNIKFSTGTLQNEISVRSQPGYTKFISNGEGTLTVNNQSFSAYVLYTRIYSLNAQDIQFYSSPIGVLTDWLAFWDENGNFYHVDDTKVTNPTPIYQSHQLGISETKTGIQAKTFAVSVDRDQETPPSKYTFNLNNPVNASLKLDRVNAINKASNDSYKWFFGQVKGEVTQNNQSLNGFGLIEYISN